MTLVCSRLILETTNYAHHQSTRLFVCWGSKKWKKRKEKTKAVHLGDINSKSGREESREDRGEKWENMENDYCNIANSLFFVEYQRRIEKGKKRKSERENERTRVRERPQPGTTLGNEQVLDLHFSVEHETWLRRSQRQSGCQGDVSESVPVLHPSVDRKHI